MSDTRTRSGRSETSDRPGGGDADEHAHSGHDRSADGHDHSHAPGEDTSTRKLALVAGINVVGFVAELGGGLLFGSVALLSDAVHMLFDALAYVMAFVASYVAANADTGERYSYGLHRLEPLSAFVNGALLIPMVVFIFYEAVQRFLDPIGIATGPTLVIAAFGLVVNLASVFVIEGGEMSLNERGAFYHLLGDAGGSLAVIVSVLVVKYLGIGVIDPITAGLIALLVLWSAGKLLRGSGAIFLHRSPFDPDAVREAIEGTEGVAGVRDLHAWQICSEITIATAHVETDEDANAEAITRGVHDVLGANGVDHATVELCPEHTHHPHLTTHEH